MGFATFPAATSSSISQKVQVFNSTGTWTCPANVTTVEAFLVGGGGGGAACGTTNEGGMGGDGCVVIWY